MKVQEKLPTPTKPFCCSLLGSASQDGNFQVVADVGVALVSGGACSGLKILPH